MRLILFFFLCFQWASAQSTLVPSEPSDTINLSCKGCVNFVTEVAITQGQHSLPLNLFKPVKLNLLHWKYYDDISKEEVVMDTEPTWTKGTLLLEAIPDTEIVSLHINMISTDSLGQEYQFLLLITGVTKQHLANLSLETTFDADTYTEFRFAALAYPPLPPNAPDKRKETYDCIEGRCLLEQFDPRKGTFAGSFDFTGNKIGIYKKAYFINGRFQR